MDTSLLKDTYKPSELLQAMVDGLMRHKDLPDFKVDMETFGRAEDDICYGCAATCALSELMGTTHPEAVRGFKDEYEQPWMTGLSYVTSYRTMEKYSGTYDRAELIDRIETAIDSARRGNTDPLLTSGTRLVRMCWTS
jgi:hypothetical protein